MAVFQSNLRKQIRNLPKILNFVKIIHFTPSRSSTPWPKVGRRTPALRRAAGAAGTAGTAARARAGAGHQHRVDDVASTRRSVCDSHYHFFCSFVSWKSRFFLKNRQFFENIPRKILHILNILEKCCILEKSRKKLVKFGENSVRFSQILRKFGKNRKKRQQFLTKILRLENGAKECIV